MKKVFVILSIIIVLVVNFLVDAMSLKDFQNMGSYYFGENSDFEYSASIAVVDDGAVIAGKTKLLKYGSDGKLKWEKPLGSYSSIMEAKGQIIAICEPNAGEIYILNTDGEILFTKKNLGRIDKVKVFESGSVGIISGEESGGSYAYIYSSKLKKLYDTRIQSSLVLDFDYNDQSAQLSILTLGDDINFYVNNYSITGEISSGIIIDSAMAYAVKLGTGGVIVMTDSGKFMPDTQDKSKGVSPEFMGDLTYFSFQDDIEIYAREQTQDVYHNNQKIAAIPLKSKFEIMLEKNLLITELGEIKLIRPDGKQLKTFKNGSSKLNKILKINDNSFVICYSNKVDFYKKGQ